MRVSVIVPTFNSARFLREAIGSVNAQTYKDYEIIIVDDGSTDDTQNVVKELDKPCKYFYQNNAGPSVARNYGISESSGEFVAFLDADDAWLPGKLEMQIRLFDGHPEVGAVETASYLCDETLKPLKFLPPARLRGHVFLDMLLKSQVPSTSTMIVRRKCLELAGRFDARYRNVQDYDLWLRLAQVCQYDYLEEGFAYQRVHSNRSVKNGRYMLEAYKHIVQKHLSNFPELNSRMGDAFFKAEKSALKIMCVNHQSRDAYTLLKRCLNTYPLRRSILISLYLSLLLIPQRWVFGVRKLYWHFASGY